MIISFRETLRLFHGWFFLHQASKGPEINSGRGAGEILMTLVSCITKSLGDDLAKPYAFCPGYRELMQRDQWAGSGT